MAISWFILNSFFVILKFVEHEVIDMLANLTGCSLCLMIYSIVLEAKRAHKVKG
jgi:hypothetical protein